MLSENLSDDFFVEAVKNKSLRAAAAKYPEETPILLSRHDEQRTQLVAQLFPKKSGMAEHC